MIQDQARRGKDNARIRSLKAKLLSALVLIIILVANGLPGAAIPIAAKSLNEYSKSLQAATTLTFISEADAQVEEHSPSTNTGTSNSLEVINANNRSMESYVRFTVSGIAGVIQTAQLRVYSTTDSTKNGPAVYTTSNTWTETGITWNNRPASTGNVLDNKSSISSNTWVDYDVTAAVTS